MTAEKGNASHDCAKCPKIKSINELKAEKGYWKTQHARAKEKVEKLEAEIIQLKAQNRYLNQKKFGRNSEKNKSQSEKTKKTEACEQKRKRGGQSGAKGPQRRDYFHLPEKTEYYDVDQKDKIVTAQGPAKLFQGGRLGISIWVELLYRKYSLGIPVNRTLKDFKSLHLNIAPGTVGDGMKRLAKLFAPIYEAFIITWAIPLFQRNDYGILFIPKRHYWH